MVQASSYVEDLSREANSFPSPKYSTVSEVKYLAAVEELKGLQLQFDAANKQAGEAVARKSLSRLEKAEADLDRIEAAMEKLYEIRNRNAPSSLMVLNILHTAQLGRNGHWFGRP